MQCYANRVRRWGRSSAFWASAALGAWVLIAAPADGQQGAGAAGKRDRAAQAKATDEVKKPAAAQASPAQPASGEHAIRQALQMKSDFTFRATPLTDIVDYLKETMKLEIKLDKKALDDANISADTPITFSSHATSIQSALELVLRELGLTWTVRDDVLLVTTIEAADSMLETRVYAVHDLLTPKPSYRFRGMYIPGVRDGGFSEMQEAAGGGGMGVMQGSSGMGGGGGSGGFFSVPANRQPTEESSDTSGRHPAAQPPQRGGSRGGGGMGGMGGGMAVGQPAGSSLNFDFDSLIEVITSTIEPTTWDNVGGPGSIAPLEPCMLIISQTVAVHQKIEKLFEQIRALTPGVKTVTIRATWLLLELKQLSQLLGDTAHKERGIDRKALEELAAKSKGYIGVITCFDGQTVHVASGRSRSAVVSAVPVVGSEPGYQPVIQSPQSGAVLQVTPLLLPNTQAAILDVQSFITRPDGPTEPIHFLGGESAGGKRNGEGRRAGAGHTTITLDRVSMAVEQLATTLKVPLGEPTLVGGLTREPSADQQEAAAGTPQLYLFIEATAKP